MPPIEQNEGKARVRTPRARELADGVADEAARLKRDAKGRIASSEAAAELGRRGGRAKGHARQVTATAAGRLPDLFGKVPELQTEVLLARYVAPVEAWQRAKVEELARDVGGGYASAGVVQLVRQAAQKKLQADFLSELSTKGMFVWDQNADGVADINTGRARTDLVSAMARLQDGIRTDLVAAHELCAKEAAARKASPQAGGSKLSKRIEKLIALEQQRVAEFRASLNPAPETSSVPVPADAPVAAASTSAPPAPTPSAVAPAIASSAQRQPEASPVSVVVPVPVPTEEERTLDAIRARHGTDGPGRIEAARACVRQVGIWLAECQRARDLWQARGSRGPKTWRPRTIPAPVSGWFASANSKGTLAAIERELGWTFLDVEVVA